MLGCRVCYSLLRRCWAAGSAAPGHTRSVWSPEASVEALAAAAGAATTTATGAASAATGAATATTEAAAASEGATAVLVVLEAVTEAAASGSEH